MCTEPIDSTSLLAQLEDQVAAALELPDRARAVAFQKLREAHPEHTVLLERCERAAASLEPELRSVDSVSQAMRTATLAEAPAEIGPYKVLDVLGEGGMGIVYLAEQQEPVRRRVALKVIKEGAGKDVLARFDVERQSLAMMNHPNIAKVLDAGVGADGRPFFAMEHVPGIALTAFCDRHRLELRTRIELFQKICHGVQHAHQKGIIHRDLKPSNILVTQRDGYVEPKIIDFGVAKALQQRLTERTLYTEQGRILGTPEYMSPEQAEMSVLDVDTRSDIYSLGVLLYHLLAGVLPIDAKALREAGYYEMQRRIREDEPPRPSTRLSTVDGDTRTTLARRRRTDLSALLVALRGDLDWIVMRCLEKDPSRRYQSASELAADLQRHLDDEPVLAGPPSVGYRLRKLVRRHRLPIAAAAVVLLALVVGLSVAVWQYGVARENAADARDAADEARRQTDAARTNEQRALAAELHSAAALTKSHALNLAAASMRALEQDPLDALLLALAAVERDETPETLGRLQVALSENYLVQRLPDAPAAIRSSDYGEATRSIVQGCVDGTVRVLDEEGALIRSLPTEGLVHSVRFSTDERHLLTVSVLGEQHVVARVFTREGTRTAEIAEVGEAGARLAGASWSPDGSRLIARCVDGGRIVLLDREGRVERELLAETGPTTTVRFLPDGRPLCSRRSRLDVWSADGEPLLAAQRPEGDARDHSEFAIRRVRAADGTLFRQTYHVSEHDIAGDPQRELLATRSRLAVSLWSSAGQLVGRLRGHSYSIHSVAFSPEGDLLVTASGDGTARLWTRAGHQVAVLNHGAEVLQARFLGSSRRILTRNRFSVALWNDKGRLLAELRGSDAQAVQHVLPGDRLLLGGGPKRSIWSLRGTVGSRFRAPHDRPYQIALTPDHDLLASADDGCVSTWSRDGTWLGAYETGTELPTYGVACSPDGRTVFAGGADGVLYAWDRRSRELSWQVPMMDGATRPLTHVYCVGDGRRIVAAMSPLRFCFLVDVETRAVELLDGRSLWAFASPDGRWIAQQLTDAGGALRLRRSDGTRITDVPVRGCWRAAFDVARGRVGFACQDGEVSVWRLQDLLDGGNGHEPIHRAQHRVTAFSVDLHPDGERLLVALDGGAYVAGLDGVERMRVWPRESRFAGYVPPVAVFSPDGEWIYGAAYDGLWRWPASPEKLVALARGVAERLGAGRDLAEYVEQLAPTGATTTGR